MIATLESVLGRAGRAMKGDPLHHLILTAWDAVDLPPWHAINAEAFVGSVDVRVNHSRWIVDCPVEGCTGASLASDTDHRFVCVSCAAGPFTVTWPADREGIEAALAGRPEVNRNWVAGESVADLLAENAEHL